MGRGGKKVQSLAGAPGARSGALHSSATLERACKDAWRKYKKLQPISSFAINITMGRGTGDEVFTITPKGNTPSAAINTETAAQAALSEVHKAHTNGTFGVGGVLIDRRTGQVIDSIENRVIQPLDHDTDGHTHAAKDPTAHGERQLITRYFERLANGEDLPPPEDITVVTSLEPCAMCSGAIMASGFGVGIVALDDTAGLGVDGERFASLPQAIQDLARQQFAYYEIEGEREFRGPRHIAHDGGVVSPETHDGCANTFIESLEGAMQTVSDAGDGVKVDPKDLREDDPIRKALVENLPHSLSLKLDDPDQPNEELLKLLKELADDPEGSGSSAVLVDPYGNVLLASNGRASDPTATGLIDVIQRYSALRFDLANDPSLSRKARESLAHPKEATIYRYPPPDTSDPRTLLELGAYGSSMEGPLPESGVAKLQFLGENIDSDLVTSSIEKLIKGMPFFYTDIVGIRVKARSL